MFLNAMMGNRTFRLTVAEVLPIPAWCRAEAQLGR